MAYILDKKERKVFCLNAKISLDYFYDKINSIIFFDQLGTELN